MSYPMPHPKNTRYVLLLVGTVASLSAEVSLFLVLTPGSSYIGASLQEAWPLFLSSVFAAVLSSVLVWWKLIIKPFRVTMGRGIGAGVLGSIMAHPLTWLFLFLFSYSFTGGDLSFGNNGGSLGQVQNLPQLIEGVIAFSVLSLLFLGWLTALVGGTGGALLILMQRKWFPLKGMVKEATHEL